MKYRVKVTMVVISLLSILFGIGGTVLIHTTFQRSIEREKSIAQKSYNMLLNTLTVVIETSDYSSLDDISDVIKKVSLQENIFCATRLSKDTEVVYFVGEDGVRFRDLRKAVNRTHAVHTVIRGEKGYYLQLCSSFIVGDKTMYLDTAYDISGVYSLRKEQQMTYLTVFAILVCLSAVISYFLACLLTKPMVKLKNVAMKIAEGEYELRSKIESTDEIGSLSREFDKMADTLVDQMERQNRFIGNFTHEIKTPMTSVIGYADLIRRGTLSKEDTVDAANYIFWEGKRLERLSVKMLELLVADSGVLELTRQEPTVLMKSITDYLKEDYKKQAIELDCSCEEGACLLEPDLFTSLVVNLLENARRAVSGGGKILMKGTFVLEGFQLVVSDNGCGIPKEALAHITDAFYRVDKARDRSMGGAGLGLALCDRIVRLHHGTMVIESNTGTGTGGSGRAMGMGKSGTSVTVLLRGGRA